MKSRGQKSNGLEDARYEVAINAARQLTRTPTPGGLRSVVSPGAILTRRGVADLQRLAGNAATGTLVQRSSEALMPQVVQRQPAEAADPSAPEQSWVGSVKGHLGDHASTYHTLNNFGDRQLEYVLRIHSTGYALLSLETQYQYEEAGRQRAWTALSAQRGKTEEVTNGLPPHSSLSLRLFGERDHTQKDQSYFAGTVEVRRKK